MSTENIVSGKKYRILTDAVNKVYDRISFWCKASDVEFNSGSNAQTTLGSITGISDSLTSTSSNVAASAASVKALNDKITELSSNLMKIKKQTYTPTVTDTIQKVTLQSTPKRAIILIINNPSQVVTCGVIIFYENIVIKKGGYSGNLSFNENTLNFNESTNELSFLYSDYLGKTIDIYYC